MRRAEGETASSLAEQDCFVVADGPLNDLRPAPAVGYIKSHRVTYLPPERNSVVGALTPGQRTPLFTIADYKRYSWYVRLATLAGGHSWTGIVRCEASGQLPLEQVTRHRRPHGRDPADRRVASHTSTRARRRTSCRSRPSSGSCATGWATAASCIRALRDAVHREQRGLVSDDRVGRVLGSEHTNTAAFRVVIDERRVPPAGRPVVVRTQVPKAGEVRTYGVVTEAEAVYEGA